MNLLQEVLFPVIALKKTIEQFINVKLMDTTEAIKILNIDPKIQNKLLLDKEIEIQYKTMYKKNENYPYLQNIIKNAYIYLKNKNV